MNPPVESLPIRRPIECVSLECFEVPLYRGGSRLRWYLFFKPHPDEPMKKVVVSERIARYIAGDAWRIK